MNTRWLIIDGYSLLHRLEHRNGSARGAGEVARDRLVRQIDGMAGHLAERITVVFDGTGPKTNRDPAAHIEVLFSSGDKTADTVIERLVLEAREPGSILVVTSDSAERRTVDAAGARSMSCGDFLEHGQQQRAQLARAAGDTRKKAHAPTLGDFFPKG
jgi:predicted RNA-binding protein with PIN domain